MRLLRASAKGAGAALGAIFTGWPSQRQMLELFLCMAVAPLFLLYLFGWRPLTGGDRYDDDEDDYDPVADHVREVKRRHRAV